MEYSLVKYPNAFPGYLENHTPRPFYHTHLEDTLEGISLKPAPQEYMSPLEKVFSNKARTSKATVKALLDEIKLREDLDSHLISTIDDEICRQHTSLMQLENVKAHYAPELQKAIDRRKTQLETNVLGLEQEKRREYLECWRDLMFMKKYLLTSLKDYWDVAKKRDLLSHDGARLLQNENGKGY